MSLMLVFAAIAGALALLIAAVVAATWAPDLPLAQLKARWAPPPSVFLDIAGMKVHVRDEGPHDDPSPIVLIHGTAASLHTWEDWTQVLKGERRVIRFDLPGFGLTGPAPHGRYTIESYIPFITAVLDKLGVRRCVICGNSLGGNIAWESALALPGRVEKLILVDAGGYAFESISLPLGFRLARMPVVNRLLKYSLSRRLIEASLKNVYGDAGKVSPELVNRHYELTLREGNRRALVQRFEQLDFGVHAHRIREVKIPTLILWGGRDRLIPPVFAERFQRDIAGSERVMFDDLGHVPHEEDPARTVAAVRRFLGS